ncbi:hypothetical protein CMQ_7035 [Grosmannia clavigera kw1407]|uniref:Uncharacterized protein n=1 Tax=Grosmannia clavigera (strain kw1407 / UAMH 11150) TaxID=655863 RepID=F0XPL7_GROCL|nr:uncharacterized protein CMQ_7035 [Grosmannia clavigera kw1407]EFX00033.1 hypothetical protein CMQ_7035 [Grosmannia clavigera kw1407]
MAMRAKGWYGSRQICKRQEREMAHNPMGKSEEQEAKEEPGVLLQGGQRGAGVQSGRFAGRRSEGMGEGKNGVKGEKDEGANEYDYGIITGADGLREGERNKREGKYEHREQGAGATGGRQQRRGQRDSDRRQTARAEQKVRARSDGRAVRARARSRDRCWFFVLFSS